MAGGSRGGGGAARGEEPHPNLPLSTMEGTGACSGCGGRDEEWGAACAGAVAGDTLGLPPSRFFRDSADERRGKMPIHIDASDLKYAAAAAEILGRHERGEPEANITSAVRDFHILTGLASPGEIVEENPPVQESRRAVDLTVLDTFMEFKRRIGVGLTPNLEYAQQLDDYLAQSQKQGRVQMAAGAGGRAHSCFLRTLILWEG